MNILQGMWKMCGGHENVMDRQTDWCTDKGHSYNPLSFRHGGLKIFVKDVDF